MSKDYIPQKDEELIAFANNFLTKVAANLTKFGLNATTTTQLENLIRQFDGEVNDNLGKQTAASAANQQKNTTKKVLSKFLRNNSQEIQKNSNTTDADRAELNLTVLDGTKTASAAPTTRPIAQVDTSQPLRHTIKFFDNVSESKARPEGVMGSEIWVKIGGESTMNEDDYKFLALDTASPYIAMHKAEDVGKKAHYLLRWVSTRGDKGAWSNVVSATITG